MAKFFPVISLSLALSAVTAASAEIRKFDQATLEDLGQAIYAQDIRAAIASELLRAQKIDPKKEGLRGWVVEGDATAMLVRFVREKDGVTEAFYDVRFDGKGKPVLAAPADRRLTEAQNAQLRARALALRSIMRPASKNYNFVILPDPEADGLLVYALAATTEPDMVQVSGHYRFTMSKDGTQLKQADELFKSKVTLNKRPKGMPEGKTVTTLIGLSLISDLPLETHVYLSLLHKLPFKVATADKHIWKVDKGRMQVVK